MNGYKIRVIHGYSFNKVSNVFKRYVDFIYNIKTNPKDSTQKSMAKSLLNNLLGRFGIKIDKPVTKLVSNKKFELLSLMNKVVSYKSIGINKTLLSYIDKLNPDIIESHNLDIVKLANKYKDHEDSIFDATSVSISAAITAYGRIHISKIKLLIESQNMGGKVYYSDTDSIVTDIKLPEHMISPKDLGKLKLEHKIDKGIFISGKTYCFITDKGEYINKAKGVKSSSLQYSDYFKLLNNINVTTAVKSQSKADWSKGEVKIEDIEVTLYSDSYKKRDKIYNNNLWINTKPIFINQIDKSLIKYYPKMSLVRYYSDTEYYTDIHISVFLDSKHICMFEVTNTSTKNYKISYLNDEIIPDSNSEDKNIYKFNIWFILGTLYIYIYNILYILFIISFLYNIYNLEDSNITEVSSYEELHEPYNLEDNNNSNNNIPSDNRNSNRKTPKSWWQSLYHKPVSQGISPLTQSNQKYTNPDIASKSDPFSSCHPTYKKSNVKYTNFYGLEKNNKDIQRSCKDINSLKETLQK